MLQWIFLSMDMRLVKKSWPNTLLQSAPQFGPQFGPIA